MAKLPEEMDNPFAEDRTEGEVAQTLEMRAEAARLKEQPVEVRVKKDEKANEESASADSESESPAAE